MPGKLRGCRVSGKLRGCRVPGKLGAGVCPGAGQGWGSPWSRVGEVGWGEGREKTWPGWKGAARVPNGASDTRVSRTDRPKPGCQAGTLGSRA